MLRLAVSLVVALAACAPDPAPLAHDAYVWRRVWTPAVADAVRAPAAPVGALRVLAHEDGPVAVDVAALAAARRPVVAVVRIDGARLAPDAAIGPVVDAARAWRARGVDVVGVEVDHDCATSALPAYAAWLRRARPPAPLRLSITALPTWAGSLALRDVAAAVDEIVVQVHAVAAPTIFDAARARRDLERFAKEVDVPLRVALPTYTVTLSGRDVAADPAAVARFVAGLRDDPVRGVAGVAWFRLPVANDARAWSATTLAAVAAGRAPPPRVSVHLALGDGDGARDVVVRNVGARDALAPTRIVVVGRVDDADGAAGYARRGDALVAARPPVVRAGSSIVVGWVRGEEVAVDAR